MPDDRSMGDIDGAITSAARCAPQCKARHHRLLPGGRQVYLASPRPGIDAAVACYPGGVGAGSAGLTPRQPVDPLTLTKDMNCPLLGIFGKEDRRPSPEHVALMEAELKKFGKTYEFQSYENAGHSIFATNRPDYRPAAADDGWKRIFAFYGKYLA
jgi:carboxymethylenebutenolidase